MSGLIFDYSDENIDTPKGKSYEPVPAGDYWLEIMECDPRTTKNGDPMVNVMFEIRNGQHDGRKVWTNITFFKDHTNKGAGIALHFLHCIGEPYTGKFKVDIMNWIGKRTKAALDIETYEGKRRNKVKWFITDLPNGAAKEAEKDPFDEEVPF